MQGRWRRGGRGRMAACGIIAVQVVLAYNLLAAGWQGSRQPVLCWVAMQISRMIVHSYACSERPYMQHRDY